MLCSFLAMVAALVALWHASASGTFARLATESSSHSMTNVQDFAKDLSLY